MKNSDSNPTSKITKIRITLSGYGGECYMGEVARDAYEYYKKHEISIEQIATDWTEELWNFIPEEYLIFSPGSPYNCSNLGHQSGATMDSGSMIKVEDQDGNEIWESYLDLSSLLKSGVNIDLCDDASLDGFEDGTVIFWGGQGEKGLFFDGEIEVKRPFDPRKLKISYSNLDGWLISSGIEYGGEEIDGSSGYDTTGKWVEHKFIIVGDEEVYEGQDRDEEGDLFSDDNIPEGSSNSPQDWEKSRRIKKGNPIHIGWYECNFSYGTTYGSLYWNGSEWQSFRNGRPIKECDTVDWWQGFNWDTSNWNNRPPEPPNTSCRKCSWIGHDDKLLQLKWGLVCPSCGAKQKDIDWIDYDPDSKEGLANRKKYCIKVN